MYPPLAILFVSVPVFVICIIAGVIILVARGLRAQALELCLAVMIAGSLVVSATGLAQVVAPLLSVPFGRGFTYSIFTPTAFVPPQESPAAVSQDQLQAQSRAAVENEFRSDLVYGGTMLVVGALLLGVLTPVRSVIRPHAPAGDSVHTTFVILMLITTTIAALSALTVAAAQLIGRYIVVPVGPSAALPQPGGAIAVAAVFTPLWIWFITRAVRESRPRASQQPDLEARSLK
jgi:hypothetical protein